jgi:hypothetical protein
VAEARLGDITGERRQDAIRHVIQEELRMWKLDGLAYNIVD